MIGIQSLKYREKKQSELASNNTRLFKETVARDSPLTSLSVQIMFLFHNSGFFFSLSILFIYGSFA